MPGSLKPFLHVGIELLHRHAGQRRGKDFLQIRHRQLGRCLAVPREHGLERLHARKFRFGLDHRRHALQAIDHLRIHRVLDPDRAVLVESGDALLGRHELRACPVRGGAHEVEDRLLRRPVVPRAQRVSRGLRLRRRGKENLGQCRSHGQCREQHAAADARGPKVRFHVQLRLRWLASCQPRRVRRSMQFRQWRLHGSAVAPSRARVRAWGHGHGRTNALPRRHDLVQRGHVPDGHPLPGASLSRSAGLLPIASRKRAPLDKSGPLSERMRHQPLKTISKIRLKRRAVVRLHASVSSSGREA